MTARFIVIEGLDGAGTTTQTERLSGWLRSQRVDALRTFEPTDGPVGRVIRTTLRNEQGAPDVHTLPWLFAADRADHLWRDVEPALHAGRWVVSDRYYHSSLAYQSLTASLDQLIALNETFRIPDLTVFLQAPVDVCLRRIEQRGGKPEIYENRERLERVASQYRKVLDTLWARGEPIIELDARGDVDDVHGRIVATVRDLL